MKKKKDVKVLLNFPQPKIAIGPEHLRNIPYQVVCSISGVCIFTLYEDNLIKEINDFRKALELNSNKKMINFVRLNVSELYQALHGSNL
jgi:hypothetical protein